MRAEIVHDDNVVGLEHSDELLLDISAEALAVDRSVEDVRSGDPVDPQGPGEVNVRQRSYGAKPRKACRPGPSLAGALCWS